MHKNFLATMALSLTILGAYSTSQIFEEGMKRGKGGRGDRRKKGGGEG